MYFIIAVGRVLAAPTDQPLPGGGLDIWTADKLVLFIAFVVPGFVSLKAYDLFSPAASKDASSQVVDAVAYSSINYALLLWPIYAVESADIRTTSPNWYIVFYVFVLLVAPISWAALLKVLRTTQFFQRSLPHPTGKPWDYVFGQRRPYWVIVSLKDGKRVGGKFSGRSFASSAPAPEQLYLEETWVINEAGGFERARTASAGVLILSAEVASIELFNLTQGRSDDEQNTGLGRIPSAKGLATGPEPATPAAGA